MWWTLIDVSAQRQSYWILYIFPSWYNYLRLMVLHKGIKRSNSDETVIPDTLGMDTLVFEGTIEMA